MPIDPFTTATALAAAIRDKQVSAREVVDAHIARIEAHDVAINAVVTRTFDAARAEADEADRRIARGEDLSGRPLHGVPYTLKDAHWTAGIRTTIGAPPMKDHVPTWDGTVVKRLRAAGAILLGKTNVPPMLMSAQTQNPIFGKTCNPWNLERTVGGSSGGSAAAIAAGLSAFDIGSDMSGSIRIPAHFCGIYGLKPTPSRLPVTGHMAFEGVPRFDRLLAVVGPMARSVGDLELVSGVLAGPDGADLDVAPIPWRAAPRRAPASLRIAFQPSLAHARTARSVVAAVERVARALADAGAHVEERAPYDADLLREAWKLEMRLVGAWMSDLLGASMPIPPPAGPPATATDVVRCLHARDLAIASANEALEGFDAFLSPVTITTAFPHSAPRSPIPVDGEEVESRFVDHYLYPWNLLGHPAVALPAGLSEEGLPVGVQLVGRRWEDEALLAVAATVSEVCGGFKPPPAYAGA